MKKAEMAKGGNIWEDSALIKAFEDAMSNYKKMHKMGNIQSSRGVEGFVSSAEKNATAGAEESDKVVRMPQENRSKTKTPQENRSKTKTSQENLSKTTTAKTENPPPADESHMDTQPALDNQDAMYDSEEYNMLLSQYYELEEKRAKILEQLYGSWDYQYSGEAAQGYTTTANQAYYPPPIWATGCFLYPYPAWQSTCSGCCTCLQTCDAENSPTSVDKDTVETGMAAAQKAISSLRINADGGDVKTEVNEHEAAPVTSSTTDLSAVLNAWYSAGLYTGKYLTEQSLLKKTNR